MSEEMSVFALLAAVAAVGLAWMDGRWRILAGLWRGLAWIALRWKYFAITFAVGGIAMALADGRDGPAYLAIVVGALTILAIAAWGREFLHLMSAGDEWFPGRSDKLVWGLALLLMPPIGAILYHRHRTRNSPAKNFSARKPASFELS